MRTVHWNRMTLRAIAVLFCIVFIALTCFIISDSDERKRKDATEMKRAASTRSSSYNLMEEKYGKNWKDNWKDQHLSSETCTLEYANSHQLQQDHPCVIHLIRTNYLRQPAPRSVPYLFDNFPKKFDPSNGQSQAILRILQNKTNGFFIEAGAHDGEFLSNTAFMEQYMNWTGLLVESFATSFKRLMTRNRKAYAVPTCLSTKPYPIEVLLNGTHSEAAFIIGEVDNQASPINADSSSDGKRPEVIIEKVQCFPLYSILLAIERTQIDFFSLDVEGAEYKILSTIPWDKVDITLLCVEWNHVPEGEPVMTRLMEDNKFIKFGHIELEVSRDVVYMKDYLADYRFLFYDEDE